MYIKERKNKKNYKPGLQTLNSG